MRQGECNHRYNCQNDASLLIFLGRYPQFGMVFSTMATARNTDDLEDDKIPMIWKVLRSEWIIFGLLCFLSKCPEGDFSFLFSLSMWSTISFWAEMRLVHKPYLYFVTNRKKDLISYYFISYLGSDFFRCGSYSILYRFMVWCHLCMK